MRDKRRLIVKKQFVTLLAASILGGQGCGGGGGDDVAPPATVPPPPAGTQVTRSIGGLWFGGLTWGASAPSPAGATVARILVAETGEFRIVMTSDPNWEMETLFSNQSEQIFGTFRYSGSNVITMGGAVATMPLGPNNTTGDHFGDFGMSGRFDSLTNFSGTFTSGYTSFLERRGTIGFTYHSIYEWPSSLARLRGNFTTTSASLSIDSQGVIFFQSAANGCTGNGQAEIIDSRYNMYRLTITAGSCTGIDAVRNGLTFTGLANLGVNNDLTGGFINETIDMALSASSVAAPSGYINWNFLAHRR
jgi:hypothetical protein